MKQAPGDARRGKPVSRGGTLWLLFLVGSATLAGLSPYLVWRRLPEHPLNVLVVDKTVPDASRREHKGLMWVLNHDRYVKRSGGGPYEYDRDYVGFFPLPDKKFRTVPIPETLAGYDLIYVADAYGVYGAEFYLNDARGSFSSLLYGGLDEKEAKRMAEAARGGVSFIAEFNTFATPTSPAARKILCELLGIEWSGWIGRYFDNLRASSEVPVWALESYKKQYGDEWAFTGPGFLLVHDDGRIVVLSTQREVTRAGLTLDFGASQAERYHVKNGVPYLYWFDVVLPGPSVAVDARFDLHVTDSGREALRRAGIPESFPAVVRSKIGRSSLYYFAGDFTDLQSVPSTWKLWRMESAYRLLPMNPRVKPEVFFWNVYVPLMQEILAEISPKA